MLFKVITVMLSLMCTVSASAQDVFNFDNSTKSGDVSQTIAFVGERVGLVAVENPCPEDYICLDVRFNARYRILDLLEGEYEGDTIDFVVYDHYGEPKFSKHDRVIIYVYQSEDGYVHHKYSYDLLRSVKGGEFAFCGDPYWMYKDSEIEEKGREDLTPFEFDPPIKLKLSDYLLDEKDIGTKDQDLVRENYLDTMRRYAPPAFKIKGNSATCKMGMSPKEVANVRMEYKFIPERAHEVLRQKCWKSAELPDEVSNDKLLEESGFNACMKSD